MGMTESALQDLMNSLSSNTKAILENNKFIIDSTLKDNEIYSKSEHKDALNNLAAGAMASEAERILGEYDKYNDTELENLSKSFAKKRDLTYVSEKNGVAEFLDATGQVVKFSMDNVKAFMAQE
ncbi:MAG: hypothetical protein IKV87_03585 [Methanobrevibacter sp.]|nr:hypothetical protein [Methanobrevibacter sp.]